MRQPEQPERMPESDRDRDDDTRPGDMLGPNPFRKETSLGDIINRVLGPKPS